MEQRCSYITTAKAQDVLELIISRSMAFSIPPHSSDVKYSDGTGLRSMSTGTEYSNELGQITLTGTKEKNKKNASPAMTVALAVSVQALTEREAPCIA